MPYQTICIILAVAVVALIIALIIVCILYRDKCQEADEFYDRKALLKAELDVERETRKTLERKLAAMQKQGTSSHDAKAEKLSQKEAAKLSQEELGYLLG